MNELRNDRRIVEFMGVAASYCKLIDELPDRWTLRLTEELPRLYLAALALPRVNEYQLTDSETAKHFRMTQQEWSLLWQRLGNSIGKPRFYWEIFEPTENPPTEPVCGDIADDLADIYRDIKEGLTAWQCGNDELIPNLLFELREVGFPSHWGPHLLSALRPLHRLCFENEST